MSSNLSFTSTPSRERHTTSGSLSTSSPFPIRTAASSSTTSLVTAASPTTNPISLETILATHANAPDPTAAALDQALSERNLFSSQNTQLWKLIEKQRSGYSHVLKELERVRNERDGFKARLQSSGLGDDLPRKDNLKESKDKERERSLKSSASSSTMASTSASLNGGAVPRATAMARRGSEDVATPRHHNHQSSKSSSQEPFTRDLTSSQPHKSSHPQLFPPLVVPPRNTSLSPTISSSPGTSSLADAVSAMLTTPTGSETPSSPHAPSDSPSTTSNGVVVKTTPAAVKPVIENTTASISLEGNDVSVETNHFPPSNPYPSQNTASALSLANTQSSSMLSPIVEDIRQRGSHDSRVSLPDEAKRYLANMGESPVPSPGLSGFEPIRVSPDPRGLQAQVTNLPDNAPSGCVARENPSKHQGSSHNDSVTEDAAKIQFLDLDEVEDDESDEKTTSKARASVEDFPLPPTLAPPIIPKPSQMQLNLQTPTQAMYNPATPSPYTPMPPESPIPSSYLNAQTPMSTAKAPAPVSFRALPLIYDDLKMTRVYVSHSSIRPNDRGKEVLSFIIDVDPGKGKDAWKVEKMYSDVLALDQRVRATVGRTVGKKIAHLPEGKLWRDHAPAKVDQRKAAVEVYLQSLIDLPVKNKDEVIAFFTSDIVRDAKKPIHQAGYKEGYLTKRGKNFGGWKSRYFVLQGPVLEYYESRGGAHLGSINITGAQIGRQQKSGDGDDEKDYRHAFLIIEARRGPGGTHPRHVLCAESDQDRDSWVEVLVRYVMGSYHDESSASASPGPSPISVNMNVAQTQSFGSGQPRSSTSSNNDSVSTTNVKRPTRVLSKDDIISRGPAVPLSQLAPDAHNAKLFQGQGVDDAVSTSPAKSIDYQHPDRAQGGYFTAEDNARRIFEKGQGSNSLDTPMSSSLPTSSPLENATTGLAPLGKRANSELGHYPDLQERRQGHPDPLSPEQSRARDQRRDRKSFHPTLNTVSSSPPRDRAPSPAPDAFATPVRGDPNGKTKVISRPINGAPIPAGYNFFGGKDAPPENAPPQSDRREKAKSRMFWGFGGRAEKPIPLVPRAVFGVPLEESLDVAEIARLPAVIFRCIQYLEAKKAELEEGIYRLSGSSAVIKSLKDRFNIEGDVDLFGSDEYWDPHAIAGLLKSFLRELPASILTRELHLNFLAVMDFVDPQERIKELSELIAALPIANYSLLRALTAHLILIVQNSHINKMTMRNVGIVFSPTLGIPAGVFGLMLGEFNRVFNVDSGQEDEIAEETKEEGGDLTRRNSKQYSDAAADKLLGLSGRSLKTPREETQSEDGDSVASIQESETDDDATVESGYTRSSTGVNSSHRPEHQYQEQQQTNDLLSPPQRSHAADVAASHGLNIAISKKGNRYSRVMGIGGLPPSPRPSISPSVPTMTQSSAPQA